MKYIVTLNGKDYEVEVSQGSADVLSVSDAAAPKAAPAVVPAPAPKAAAPAPAPAPKAAPAPVPAPAPKAAAPAGGETVTAPMPGTILKVLVAQGAPVKKGEAVVVLEAMKMENEIFAPCDGTVTQLSTSVGASVNSGDALLTIG